MFSNKTYFSCLRDLFVSNSKKVGGLSKTSLELKLEYVFNI